MAKTDDDDRVDALKRRLAQISGGKMVAWESDALPADVREKFWRSVLGFEEAEQTTLFQQLVEARIELPEPESLDDQQVTAKLWKVIHALARMDTFISQTNHLTDRELYTLLWQETLREDIEVPEEGEWVRHFALLSTGSEENTRHYLRYYADDDERRRWLVDFPDFELPPHEHPPHDRDSHLPQPGYEPPH